MRLHRTRSNEHFDRVETGIKTIAAAHSMSALGHKRTFAVQKGMSALPPIADINPVEHRCSQSPLVSRGLGRAEATIRRNQARADAQKFKKESANIGDCTGASATGGSGPGGKIDKFLNLSNLVMHQPVR